MMHDVEFPKFRFSDRHGWSRIISGIAANKLDDFRELYRLFWRRYQSIDVTLQLDFMSAIAKDSELYTIALQLCEMANIDADWITPHIVAGLVHSYTAPDGTHHFGVLQKLYFPNPDQLLPK